MRSVWASNMNLNLKRKYLLLIKRNINCQLQVKIFSSLITVRNVHNNFQFEHFTSAQFHLFKKNFCKKPLYKL